MEESKALSQPWRAGLFHFVHFTTSLLLFAVPGRHLPAPRRELRGEGLRGGRFPRGHLRTPPRPWGCSGAIPTAAHRGFAALGAVPGKLRLPVTPP